MTRGRGGVVRRLRFLQVLASQSPPISELQTRAARSRLRQSKCPIFAVDGATEEAMCFPQRQSSSSSLILPAVLTLLNDRFDQVAARFYSRDKEHFRQPAIRERTAVRRL